MRTIDTAERRARLGARHALAAAVPTAEEATAAVGLLHSTDPVTVHVSARARTRHPGTTDVERALYDDRTLLRVHGMRRTLWVVPAGLEPAVRVAGALPLAARERARLRAGLEPVGLHDPDRWRADVEEATVAALAAAPDGELSAVELGRAVPELATKMVYGAGTKWPAEVSVASRLLLILGFEGRIVRTRSRGTWVSGQYRYAPGPAVTGGGATPTAAEARAAVVGTYVARFGPVTLADVRWWTGWTVAPVRAALAACGAVEVAVDEGPAWVAADDVEPVAPPEPWVALLPSLDPTTMGWKERSWYLGAHGPLLFDRNGNAGSTVWADGRIVGAWGQRPDGTIVTRLLEDGDDVGASVAAAVDTEAAALTDWFAGQVITPRFRSPLERELSAP